MAHGGKRAGAGRRAGSKGTATLEREELLRQFCLKVSERFDPLTDALLSAAQGVQHLMARDRDGTWTEVTDPVIMAKVLNSGETFYRIYARNPDVKALKDIFDRLFGTPRQQVDMQLNADVDLVSILQQRLARARQRGKDR